MLKQVGRRTVRELHLACSTVGIWIGDEDGLDGYTLCRRYEKLYALPTPLSSRFPP